MHEQVLITSVCKTCPGSLKIACVQWPSPHGWSWQWPVRREGKGRAIIPSFSHSHIPSTLRLQRRGCCRDLGGTRHPWRRGQHQLAKPSRCTSCRQPRKPLWDGGPMAIHPLLPIDARLRWPFLALSSHSESPGSCDGCKESGRSERDGAKFPWTAGAGGCQGKKREV